MWRNYATLNWVLLYLSPVSTRSTVRDTADFVDYPHAVFSTQVSKETDCTNTSKPVHPNGVRPETDSRVGFVDLGNDAYLRVS